MANSFWPGFQDFIRAAFALATVRMYILMRNLTRNPASDNTILSTIPLRGLNDPLHHVQSISNILPSYEMHQAIVAKSLSVTLRTNQLLPSYNQSLQEFHRELIPRTSLMTSIATIEQDLFSSTSEGSSFSARAESLRSASAHCCNTTSLGVFSDNTSLDGSVPKLLDSCHVLENYDSSAVSIALSLFSKRGEPCVVSNIGTPNQIYTNGDVISGFIIVENVSNRPVPFNRFYVILEGNVWLTASPETSNRKVKKNFLQQLDIGASFNFASMTEASSVDHDGLRLEFDSDRILRPGVQHKRFFAFRIPDRALGNTRTSGPTDLPSSFDAHLTMINLGFLDISVEYSIQAKFISRDETSSRYVILKESTRPFKVVARAPNHTPGSRSLLRSLEIELRGRAYERIEAARQLKSSIPGTKPAKRIDEKTVSNCSNNIVNYDVTSSFETHIVNRRLGGGKQMREQCDLKVCIPMSELRVKHISPDAHTDCKDVKSWMLNIPVYLTSQRADSSSKKLLEITNVTASLEVFNVRPESSPIPLELDFDFLIDNGTLNDFTSIIVRPYATLYNELSSQLRAIPDKVNFAVEGQLMRDLRSMGTIKTLTRSLGIIGIQMSNSKTLSLAGLCWKRGETQATSNEFTKKLILMLDLTSAHQLGSMSKPDKIPAFKKYNFVPSFQNPLLGRLYFVHLKIYILNGSIVHTKIPLTICT